MTGHVRRRGRDRARWPSALPAGGHSAPAVTSSKGDLLLRQQEVTPLRGIRESKAAVVGSSGLCLAVAEGGIDYGIRDRPIGRGKGLDEVPLTADEHGAHVRELAEPVDAVVAS
jgi:hypothetical protein